MVFPRKAGSNLTTLEVLLGKHLNTMIGQSVVSTAQLIGSKLLRLLHTFSVHSMGWTQIVPPPVCLNEGVGMAAGASIKG